MILNKSNIYLIGVFLMFLHEMLPILPTRMPIFSAALFIIYIAINRLYVSKTYLHWLAFVFIFFAFSTIWSLKSQESFWVLQRLIPIYIGVVASYSFMSHSQNGIVKILWIYLIASSIYIVYIIFNLEQIEEGARLGRLLNEEIEENDIHFNSNNIGMCLCYALYAGYILFKRKERGYIISIIAICAGLFVLYLTLITGSRKALFMLVIPLLMLPFLEKKRRAKISIFSMIIGVLLIGYNLIMDIPFFYNIMGHRMEDLFNIISGQTQGTEDISRFMLVEYGITWFKESPVIGYGINNFRVLSNQTSEFLFRNFYAHNNYIELLVDVGAIGFLIYYSCYIHFWKKLKGNIFDNKMNSCIFLLIIVRLFLDTAQVSYYSFIANLIICICFYATEQSNNQIKYKYEAS